MTGVYDHLWKILFPHLIKISFTSWLLLVNSNHIFLSIFEKETRFDPFYSQIIWFNIRWKWILFIFNLKLFIWDSERTFFFLRVLLVFSSDNKVLQPSIILVLFRRYHFNHFRICTWFTRWPRCNYLKL